MPSGNVAIVGLNGRHDGRRRQLVVGVESLQLHACGHSALVWDGGDALADCGALLRDEEHLVVGPRLRERHQLVRVVLELNGDHPRAATPLRGKGVDAHALAVTPSCHDQQHLAAIFDHGIRRAARRADASHERLRLRVPLPRPPHNVHVRDGIARPKRDRLDAARSPPRRPQLLAVGVEAERLAEARAEEDRVVRGADACVRELVVLAQRDGDEPAAGDALEGGERCLFYETVSREEHKEGGVGEVGDGQELGDRLVRLYGQQLLQEHAARCARGQRHAEGLEGICDATLRDAQDGVVRLAREYARDRVAVTEVGHARLAARAAPLRLELVDGHPLDEAAGRLHDDAGLLWRQVHVRELFVLKLDGGEARRGVRRLEFDQLGRDVRLHIGPLAQQRGQPCHVSPQICRFSL
mmetsp:Transcript_17055/g.55552  ORF Transcript_17055/g.55552 Transcript_17055/m.55552 type:complete len:412 (+) Transcript_17055:291-1526(+)